MNAAPPVPLLLAGLLGLVACSDPVAPADGGADGDRAPPADAAPGADGGSGWRLVFADEFDGQDGAGPDPGRWVAETGGGGWGNGELQSYTARSDNAAQQGGRLVITARKEAYQGSAYTSARLKTAGRFAFTYGRVEMSAQLPSGAGIWPAFWMLGANIDKGIAWPDCGEIDVMEFVGKTPSRIYGTIHGPGYNGAGGLGAWHEAQGLATGLHQYAIEWEPGVVRWYFDGALYEQRSVQDLAGRRWVYDHDFFLILNLAIGGAFPGPPDQTTVFPQRYAIDYVRVYQRSGPLPDAPPRRIVALRARGSGKFVSADLYNGDRLFANRNTASTWEYFEPRDLGGAKSALLALSGYKLVSAAAGPLTAAAEAVGAAETFTLVKNGDGSTSLRASSGKYVSAPRRAAR